MSIIKIWSWIVGVVFLTIGVIGLFGGFSNIAVLHDIIHVVTGFVFIFIANRSYVNKFNAWFGGIYLLIGILGFLGLMNFIGVDTPINIVHVAVGLISLLIGTLSH